MPVIQIVCGPTASGKSARALDIAQSQDGVIINADAMQVYRELRILTARPTPEDEAYAPHRLYGILPAHEACSAARWLELAKPVIDETLDAGKLPVVTGGTGLYIFTLMRGLSPIPDIPAQIRHQAMALWAEQKDGALQERDPVMHARLKPGDSQRHVRALEVWLASGKSLRHWQELPRQTPYPDAEFKVELIDLPREELYHRCEKRFEAMLEHGALEEATRLRDMHLAPHLPAMHALGVPELIGHLDGRWSLAEAIRRAQQATRNYAKRQVTWFRHQLKQ
jgi:tRNA dimethylallyltransferase